MRTLASIAIFLAVSPLSGCSSSPDILHYKMTVEVETPVGMRTGYAVREVKIIHHDSLLDKLPFPLEGGQSHAEFKGEAIAVDIAPGQTLYALLTGANGNVDYAINVPNMAFPQKVHSLAELYGHVFDLPHFVPSPIRADAPVNQWPLLVRFRDSHDPKSVELVEPTALDKVFGPGMKLRRVTVQVTDEPVTTGIRKRLSWLGGIHGSLMPMALKDSPPIGTPLPLATTLTESDFSRDASK